INDPLIAALGNPRVQGGLQVATGLGQATAAFGAAEVPIIGPYFAGAIGLRAVDNLYTGGSKLFSGSPQNTFLNTGINNTLKKFGASPTTSQTVASYAETGVDIATLLPGAFARLTPPPVKYPELPILDNEPFYYQPKFDTSHPLIEGTIETPRTP